MTAVIETERGWIPTAPDDTFADRLRRVRRTQRSADGSREMGQIEFAKAIGVRLGRRVDGGRRAAPVR